MWPAYVKAHCFSEKVSPSISFYHLSLMLRRAPSASWLNEHWQEEMKKIETCIECGQCTAHCPYELDTPNLLKKNYEDYKKVLAGEVKVD